MTEITTDRRADVLDPEGQVGRLELSFGRTELEMSVRVTPTGLLAIGALVSSILLSTAALVWVSTAAAPPVGRGSGVAALKRADGWLCGG